MANMKKPAPKKITGKPVSPANKKFKVDKNGKRILTGTGTVTKNETFPDLRKPGGISGPAVKPKTTPKPKSMQKLKPTPKFSK